MSLVLLARTPCLLSGSQSDVGAALRELCGRDPILPGVLACSPSSLSHSAAYRYSSESRVDHTAWGFSMFFQQSGLLCSL